MLHQEAALERGNGLPDYDICSIWLDLPSSNKPFWAVMQCMKTVDRAVPAVEHTGHSHLAIEASHQYEAIEGVRRLVVVCRASDKLWSRRAATLHKLCSRQWR